MRRNKKITTAFLLSLTLFFPLTSCENGSEYGNEAENGSEHGNGNETGNGGERESRTGICNPDKKYLVVKTYAGLGNRLRILASSSIMAGLTGRHLVVYWEKIDKEMPALWDDLFLNPMIMIENSKLNKERCTIERIKNSSSSDSIVENMGAQNDKGDQENLAEIPQFDKPIVYFETSLNFAPEEQYLSANEYNFRYANFYKSLVPNKWIQNEIKAFKKKHDFEKKHIIGVHYRSWNAGPADERGDELQRDLNFRYVPEYIKKMKAALNRASNRIGKKQVAFFLATDSLDVKKAIASDPDLKGRIITRNVQIERETLRGQESALVDFFLLGSGEFIIGTYQSSFSDEAKFLTRRGYKENVGEAAYKI